MYWLLKIKIEAKKATIPIQKKILTKDEQIESNQQSVPQNGIILIINVIIAQIKTSELQTGTSR